MSDAKTTFDELNALLSGISGITVESTNIWPGGFGMTLTIRKTNSVGPIVYCANGANIPVEVYSAAPSGNLGERAKPKHLRYRLTSKITGNDRELALDRFAMFGNHLVWHLHAIDALTTREANRLLKLWNGRHVRRGGSTKRTIPRPTSHKGDLT
jgi:hypothetical protein